jgi:Xaa-Pro aminopeptidase
MLELNEKINIISGLQRASAQTFCSVVPLLKTGMSEFQVADLLRNEFADRGIEAFWYDVPIIVLIGSNRLLNGANADYQTKSPSKDVVLAPGSTIYVDLHPQDSVTGLWGDWNTMAVFQPRPGIDDEQVAFLAEMREIHRRGFDQVQPHWSGADLIHYYRQAYHDKGITQLQGEKPDIGHTIHAGPKINAHRLLLDESNTNLLADHFYAIEPAGSRQNKNGSELLVGRFEECVYFTKAGKAILLGDNEQVPLTI